MTMDFTRREIHRAAELDGKQNEVNDAYARQLSIGNSLINIKNALLLDKSNPLKRYEENKEKLANSRSLALSSMLSYLTYETIVKKQSPRLSENDLRILYNNECVKLAQEHGIDVDVFKTVYEFSERLRGRSVYSNTMMYNDLIEDNIKKITKEQIRELFDKITINPNFNEHVTYEKNVNNKTSKFSFKIEKMVKEIPFPKNVDNKKSEFSFKIENVENGNSLKLYSMLTRKNFWFGTALAEKTRVDYLNVAFRIVFLILTISVVKTILEINKDYKELIIEKLNKTRCFVAECGYLGENSIIGELSTFDHRYNKKIKRGSTIDVLNEYIEMYSMFKNEILNIVPKDLDSRVAKNVDLVILRLSVQSKDTINLASIFKIDSPYIINLLDMTKGVHLYEILMPFAEKLSKISVNDVAEIDIEKVYEYIYGQNPNCVLDIAEVLLKD